MLRQPSTKPPHYWREEYKLDTARDQEEILNRKGDFIIVEKLSGKAELYLNAKSGDPISLSKFKLIHTPYEKVYMTNTAQVGGKITLMFGGAAAFESRELMSDVEIHTHPSLRIREGFMFVERWSRLGEDFDKKFISRVEGAFFKSDSTEDKEDFVLPAFEEAVNGRQAAPFDNMIHMRNAKPATPTVADELYIGIPLAFKRARFRFDALFPTTVQLAATDQIFIGFEAIFQGGYAIFCLKGSNGAYTLEIATMGEDGPESSTTAVTINNTNADSDYMIEIDPPYFRFYQSAANGGAIDSVTSVKIPEDAFSSDMWLIPFFANEGSTVESNFYIGNLCVWRLDKAKVGNTYVVADEAANDSDKTITVPAGKRWKIKSIRVELTTTADAGNRQLDILFTDSADDVIFDCKALNVQIASQTEIYHAIPTTSLGDSLETVAGRHWLGFPLNTILIGGDKIRIYDSAAIQAAADDMVIQMMVEEV